MKRTLISAACLLMGAAAFAQNLNPTVEVTNAYVREASGIEKPSQLMELPDSVLRFNLDFEYAVNETPYRGAYEFKPYLVQLRPLARPSKEGSFYLRAGAGYTFQPEFSAVYTPVASNKFHVNLYAGHDSYIGPYVGDWKGSDLRSRVGADMLLGWRRGSLSMNVQYNNVFARDYNAPMNHHQVEASARVQNVPGTTRVDYDVKSRVSYVSAPEGFSETHTLTDVQLGSRLLGRNLRLLASAETVSQPGGTAASLSLTPRYMRGGARFSFNAGVKFAYVFRSEDAFAPTPGGYFFPDVQLSWKIVPEYLTLFAAVTGGNELVSYESLLSQNSFIDAFSATTDVKRVNVAAVAGLRGNIAHRFGFEVKGGYSWMGNSWLWGKTPSGEPAFCYGGPIHVAFVDVEGGWKNHFLDIKAHLKYMKTLNKPTVITPAVLPFLPAEYSGDAHIFYNWGSRIRAGLTFEGRSQMVCPAGGAVPAYLDLGMQADFRMTPTLGFWSRFGNLLNTTIERVPFYARKGPFFTVGVSLSL